MANINLMFRRGLQANLPASAVDGTIYFATDTGRMFVGVGESLVAVSEDIKTYANIAALPSTANSGDWAYAAAENALAYYNGTKWVQVNPDTGATGFEVVGTGNAITDVSYDASTRKLTLTKGETYATKAELDAISGTVEASKPEVYQVTSDETDVDVIAADITGKAGDVLIVTSTAGIKSAYHFDAEDGWVACDGLVDASKCIINQDITLAGDYTQVGTLTKSKTGTATFATEGKSVQAALIEMLSQRLQPTITSNPAVTLTFSQAKAYEVGTTVNPSYTASLSAGAYTYGPETGITATAWEITNSDGGSATTASGSFDSFEVTDDTNYTITATATYDQGAVAVDNLGDESNPVVQIAAGSKSKTSGAVTGYRAFFYGVLPTSTAEAPLTSTIIRGLTNGGAYNSSKTFTLNGSDTAKRIVIAVPSSSTRSGLKEVILTSAMNTPVTDSYVKTASAVEVAGAGSASAVSYDVWVYEPSKIDAGEVHKITLA